MSDSSDLSATCESGAPVSAGVAGMPQVGNIWLDGRMVPAKEAKVSVFDSLVQGGDGCWEGLRVYQGKIFRLGQHLQRRPRGLTCLWGSGSGAL